MKFVYVTLFWLFAFSAGWAAYCYRYRRWATEYYGGFFAGLFHGVQADDRAQAFNYYLGVKASEDVRWLLKTLAQVVSIPAVAAAIILSYGWAMK